MQINGKKKLVIETPRNTNKEVLIKTIQKDLLKDDINKLEVKKVIFVPNKIINFVI